MTYRLFAAGILAYAISLPAHSALVNCAKNDVTFGIPSAAATSSNVCASYTGNTNGNAAEQAAVNMIVADAFDNTVNLSEVQNVDAVADYELFSGADFSFVTKDDGSSGAYSGATFTLSSTAGSTGTFELTWVPTPLDLIADVILLTKSASGGVGVYLFLGQDFSADKQRWRKLFDYLSQQPEHLTRSLAPHAVDASGHPATRPDPRHTRTCAAGVVSTRWCTAADQFDAAKGLAAA